MKPRRHSVDRRQAVMGRPARLRAWLERKLCPHVGTCYRCDRPWRTHAVRDLGTLDGVHRVRQLGHLRYGGLVGVDGHVTDYGGGRGCFPLCEGCWGTLTPEERLPYYDRLVTRWIWQLPDEREHYERERPLILNACLDEISR